MMSVLRNKILFAAATIAAGMMFVPAGAQAACNSGACPITGGGLRIQIGGGFIIPHLTPFASQGGPIVGQPMTFANTAMGFIVPKPTTSATISGAPPYTIKMGIGKMTYGDALTPGLSGTLFNPGRFTTPKLVQVPLWIAGLHTFLGVSTNIGQSFPGDARTFMNVAGTTTIGGPVTFAPNGRAGNSVLTTCAGALVPAVIPANWQGGCNGATPTTTGLGSGGPGVQITPVIVKYEKTANQFGGLATTRQVKRTPIIAPGEATWLGRIRFNRFGAIYTTVQMQDTINPKTYPTLQQNLVEPVVWGAQFGQIVQRIGALVPPGDLVSGRITPGGAPVNTATQIPIVVGGGVGAATTTSYGGPMTTGRIVVSAMNPGAPTTIFTNTGSDQRTPNGQGQVSLVSGSLSVRTSFGVGVGGTERTMLTIKLPEPSMALGLVAGVVALAGVSRRRNR